MEENKYFTPNIEDFHIGYQYEIFQKGKPYDLNFIHFMPQPEEDTWVKMTYPDAFLGYNLKRMFEIYQIRVPYLTKEQIEAEGWTSFVTEYKGDIVPENMTYTFFREDRNYMLSWNFNTNKITLIIKDPSLVENYYTEPTFRGECKDINTFRKIIKLLKIN